MSTPRRKLPRRKMRAQPRLMRGSVKMLRRGIERQIDGRMTNRIIGRGMRRVSGKHLCLLLMVALFWRATPADAAAASGERGMVVTVNPIATDAAVEVMRGGGNAVDAAVAAALMLGVVEGHNSGIGGGCFMLIRTGGGEIVALD